MCDGTTLTNGTRTARKRTVCQSCFDPIYPGDRYAYFTVAYEGTVETLKMHPACQELESSEGADDFDGCYEPGGLWRAGIKDVRDFRSARFAAGERLAWGYPWSQRYTWNNLIPDGPEWSVRRVLAWMTPWADGGPQPMHWRGERKRWTV